MGRSIASERFDTVSVVVLRDGEGNILDPERSSPVELYRQHSLSSESRTRYGTGTQPKKFSCLTISLEPVYFENQCFYLTLPMSPLKKAG
jgi:hypothetical protein